MKYAPKISLVALYSIKYRWLLYWALPSCFSVFVMLHTTFSPWINFFVSIIFTGLSTIGFIEMCELSLKWCIKRFMANKIEAMQKEISEVIMKHIKRKNAQEQRPSVH